MKVYKGYLIAIKRNISTIILYCTIFLGVAVSMVYLSGREQTGGSYAQMRLSIGVVDRDNSLWSHALEDYLEKYHDILMESVAETSEEFMERYFAGEEFSVEDYQALYQQMVDGTLVVDDDYTVLDNPETATDWSNVNLNII